MRRFRFKFEKLQMLRERDENTSLLRLTLAQEDLAREEALLTGLVGAIEDSGSRLSDLMRQGAQPDMLRNADAFRCATSDAAARQRGEMQRAAKEVDEKRVEFDGSYRRAEAIRQLHEKGRQEHRKESLKEEQKELDEIGGRAHKAVGSSHR